ncbi:MAG: hypothetical protein Tsb0034_20230 [Ekhidna sp.]
MKKTKWNPILRAIAITIMLVAFPIVPDNAPWYYGVILFDVGLFLLLATKWASLKKKTGLSQ